MKLLPILTLVFTTAFSSFCYAEQEETALSVPVTPIKQIETKQIDFESLPKESQVGNLSELVKEDSNLLDAFVERIRSHAILYPYAEGMAYVNGQLCHVGNYTQSVIYTVLDGPYYGTQTTLTYDGVILYVNYDYKLKYIPGGVIFHHYYSDSKVITGSTQVIKFY